MLTQKYLNKRQLLLIISALLTLTGCHRPASKAQPTSPVTSEQIVLPSSATTPATTQRLSAADHALFAAVYTKAAFTPEEGTHRPGADWSTADLQELAEFTKVSPYFGLQQVTTALANGANPNAICDGLTPLIHAASSHHPEALAIVKCLIAAGADVNAQPSFWCTPLTNAIQLLDLSEPHSSTAAEIIKILIAAGSNPNANGGMAPALMILASRNHPQAAELVQLLLSAGADANADNAEATALMSAAASPNPAALTIVQHLLAAGANVHIKTAVPWHKGYTAIDFALRSANPAAPAIVAALRTASAQELMKSSDTSLPGNKH